MWTKIIKEDPKITHYKELLNMKYIINDDLEVEVLNNKKGKAKTRKNTKQKI